MFATFENQPLPCAYYGITTITSSARHIHYHTTNILPTYFIPSIILPWIDYTAGWQL